jgi:pyruvate/2-oxoglutarate dehydrogenase complex dihydrolipoamide acyltransferase (E2) component
MKISVNMPHLGYDMSEGTILTWLKAPGDEIVRGDVIAEIETDKATIEMEALASGTLTEIVVDAGAAAEVGSVIAYLEDDA